MVIQNIAGFTCKTFYILKFGMYFFFESETTLLMKLDTTEETAVAWSNMVKSFLNG